MGRNVSPSDKADRLMANLLSDPETFTRKGWGNDLLRCFLRGHPIEKLRPLLESEIDDVVKNGIWIASELPREAPFLLHDAIKLAKHPRRYIRYFALDVIILGSVGAESSCFAHVIEALADRDPVLVEHGLFLITKASESQLRAARETRGVFPEEYYDWLDKLLSLDQKKPSDVEVMLGSSDSLERQLGLVFAEKMYGAYPNLLKAAASVDDKTISSLARHFLNIHDTGEE